MDWTSPNAWIGTRAALREASGLHPDAYTSDAFFEAEQQRVFERAWVVVATAPEVRTPGRLLARKVGSRSIIITADNDGVVRGFLNSCRHRGTELAESDCDIAGTIRCPYHRWGYGLDGSLLTTPLFEDVPRASFDKADHGLVPVRVEIWGVLVFACLDAETPPLAEWLGDLPDRMAGYGLEDWREIGRAHV